MVSEPWLQGDGVTGDNCDGGVMDRCCNDEDDVDDLTVKGVQCSVGGDVQKDRRSASTELFGYHLASATGGSGRAGRPTLLWLIDAIALTPSRPSARAPDPAHAPSPNKPNECLSPILASTQHVL
ncbi:hypothetical protein EVAR_2497_1 [Eumeta japonica]|uniref:Uncharacterized protein n=1 Tax=Eumeta variegata TaxID=151549 RepID=A0A4C1SNQ6_EUMVA|nr:hypothetical protein EVAR_2497_1 [Eumeta japonica]